MIGLRIAAMRKRAGMSQRELARRLGVSASAVGMYEQGRREPSAEKLVRLAQLLDVSVDYLLTGTPATGADRQAAQDVLHRTLSCAAAQEVILRSADGTERPLDETTAHLVLAALLGS